MTKPPVTLNLFNRKMYILINLCAQASGYPGRKNFGINRYKGSHENKHFQRTCYTICDTQIINKHSIEQIKKKNELFDVIHQELTRHTELSIGKKPILSWIGRSEKRYVNGNRILAFSFKREKNE